MVTLKDKYELHEILGDGTYGVVYRATHRESGDEVAFKKLKKQNDEDGVSSSTLREISLLKELQHINIIRLVEVINTVKGMSLVFEYAPNDLKKIIDDTNSGKGLDKDSIKVREIKNSLFFYRVIYIKLFKEFNIFISNIKFFTEI